MPLEIERKFLVEGSFIEGAQRHFRIVQGYLSSAPERTVRVRLRDNQGFLTIKGAGSASGASRFEWEQPISSEDAQALLALCEPGVIDKTRYEVPYGKHIFEVDVFHAENEGLVLAEVELADENESFERPPWLGQEVTGDPRYYNAMLKKNSFRQWAVK